MATGRQYHTQQVHFLRKTITYSNRATAVTVGVIPSGSVIIPAMSGVVVTTVFNGSGTDLLDIGTTANDDLYATDLTLAATNFIACDETGIDWSVSADTTITATYADQNSDATTGVAEVVICYIPDNDG